MRRNGEKLLPFLKFQTISHPLHKNISPSLGIPRDEEKWGETLTILKMTRIPRETWFLQNRLKKLGLLIILVCKSHEMKSSSRGGGRVWTNLRVSHEMRRYGEKLSPFWKWWESQEKFNFFKIHCKHHV